MGYRDLIVVFSSVDSDKILEEVRRRPPSSSARAIKVDKCVEADLAKIIEACMELIKQGTVGRMRSIKVECSKRGRYVESCKAVEIAVGVAVESSGLARIDLKSPSTVVKVEIVDDRAYIGITPPSYDKLHSRYDLHTSGSH